VEGRDRDFAPLWARLDHAAVAWSDAGRGTLRAKLLEGLDEITYLDEAHLTVVEHPPGHEVVSSSALYWPMLHRDDPREFYALRTAALRAPLRARFMGREDATAALGTLDDVAAPYALAEDDFYELDFGPVRDAARTRLVVEGWKFKEERGLPSSVERRGPRLEVRDAGGRWHEVRALALPRGDRKAVAFDLGGLAWPEGRYHFRLYTGTDTDGMAMWYLDRVRLTEEAPAPVTTFDVSPARAELAWDGVPTFVDAGHDHPHPQWNVDDGGGAILPGAGQWGAFTRYGDVRALLAASDDLLAVFRLGDGVELSFEDLPPAPPGLEHTYFLAADLVYKPRVCAGCPGPTPLSEWVEPLPWHGMGHYPPPDGRAFPDDPAHRDYLRVWNTRLYLPGEDRWGSP
jgi:hypothetical protein